MAGFNIKHWFADGAFRTIIRNSAWLGSSNVVSALLGLLALSCAGKGMTPAMFGVLVIVQSYAKSISDFIKFQTWQLVVQYGTPALTNNNPQQFRNVVSFSFSLDIVSGAVAIVGGIALLPFLSHSLGLDDQSFWLAALYCTLIPSMASSTPTGILRAVDSFDLIAVQQATKPFLRAAGASLPGILTLVLRVLLLPGTPRILLAAPCTGGLPHVNYAAEISITRSN